MPSLEPVVVRMEDGVVPFDLWPVASRERLLWLNGQMAAAEVGMAVWAIFCGSGPVDEVPVPDTPAAALGLISDFDDLCVAGGLRVVDPVAGITIEPECCCYLTDWRDWQRVLDGVGVDLGHFPTPWFEFLDGVVRIWTDGGHLIHEERDPILDREFVEYRYIDLDRRALPDLLRAAHRDLVGFLALLRTWADEIAPQQAERFVRAVDNGLQITASLPL